MPRSCGKACQDQACAAPQDMLRNRRMRGVRASSPRMELDPRNSAFLLCPLWRLRLSLTALTDIPAHYEILLYFSIPLARTRVILPDIMVQLSPSASQTSTCPILRACEYDCMILFRPAEIQSLAACSLDVYLTSWQCLHWDCERSQHPP